MADSSISNLPIITLTTDFGLDDWYVATLKAVLLSHAPAARLIDVTHTIPAGDIVKASITLERVLAAFPPATIHLAVIDPTVGSERLPLIVQIQQQLVVCPDNGLITWPWRRRDQGEAFQITWKSPSTSQTFHGRDLFSPIAGMLASGRALLDLAKPLQSPVLLDLYPSTGPTGKIIHIDHFGNATINILSSAVPSNAQIQIRDRKVTLKRTYSEVPSIQPLALIGSSDLLEIAVRDASAAQTLTLKVGDSVTILFE